MDSQFIKNYTLNRVSLPAANTEVELVLSGRPVRISISSDDFTSQILFSFTSSASGTGKRIFQGAEWTSPGFVWGETKSLFMQSPNAGATAVVEQWEAP